MTNLFQSPIVQRIAELRMTQKCRGLDTVQQNELDLCLDWVVNKCWTEAMISNLSLMASISNDMDWMHEICRDSEDVG